METETYLFNDTFDHNLALKIIDNLQDFGPRGFNAFFSTFESDLKNEEKLSYGLFDPQLWIVRRELNLPNSFSSIVCYHKSS